MNDECELVFGGTCLALAQSCVRLLLTRDPTSPNLRFSSWFSRKSHPVQMDSAQHLDVPCLVWLLAGYLLPMTQFPESPTSEANRIVWPVGLAF